jgi:predicted nucleotidyltransferase
MLIPMSVESRLADYFAISAPAGLIAAYLFGSHAEGRAHRESDVDVAVALDLSTWSDESGRFDERVRLSAELVSVTGSNEVDVVVLNDAPPLLARRIVLDGRCIHCADSAAERRFRRDVVFRAADLEPWLERQRRRTLEALSR